MHKVGVIPKRRIQLQWVPIVVMEIFVLHGKVPSRAKRPSAARRVGLIWCGTKYGVYGIRSIGGRRLITNNFRYCLAQFEIQPDSPALSCRKGIDSSPRDQRDLWLESWLLVTFVGWWVRASAGEPIGIRTLVLFFRFLFWVSLASGERTSGSCELSLVFKPQVFVRLLLKGCYNVRRFVFSLMQLAWSSLVLDDLAEGGSFAQAGGTGVIGKWITVGYDK